MKINGENVLSIKPFCTKDKPCLLCSMVGYSKGSNNPQCLFCNFSNRLIVRTRK